MIITRDHANVGVPVTAPTMAIATFDDFGLTPPTGLVASGLSVNRIQYACDTPLGRYHEIQWDVPGTFETPFRKVVGDYEAKTEFSGELVGKPDGKDWVDRNTLYHLRVRALGRWQTSDWDTATASTWARLSGQIVYPDGGMAPYAKYIVLDREDLLADAFTVLAEGFADLDGKFDTTFYTGGKRFTAIFLDPQRKFSGNLFDYVK